MNSTEKLSLILQHADEYYNGRQYYFINDGFISYETFEEDGIKCIYFADMFIAKKSRGGKSLGDLVQACEQLGLDHKTKRAYCQVLKNNPYLDNIQAMYAKIGFEYFGQDKDALFYKCDRS